MMVVDKQFPPHTLLDCFKTSFHCFLIRIGDSENPSGVLKSLKLGYRVPGLFCSDSAAHCLLVHMKALIAGSRA